VGWLADTSSQRCCCQSKHRSWEPAGPPSLRLPGGWQRIGDEALQHLCGASWGGCGDFLPQLRREDWCLKLPQLVFPCPVKSPAQFIAVLLGALADQFRVSLCERRHLMYMMTKLSFPALTHQSGEFFVQLRETDWILPIFGRAACLALRQATPCTKGFSGVRQTVVGIFFCRLAG